MSKVVTVDVKGNWQRWLKVRDLTKGVTYFFRVQARTIAYGPELRASVTAGPAEGEYPASFVRSGVSGLFWPRLPRRVLPERLHVDAFSAGEQVLRC